MQPVIEEFRTKGILVGRPFPPMVQHLRVSVGVPDEMDRFLKAFKEIFPKKTTTTTGSRMSCWRGRRTAGPAPGCDAQCHGYRSRTPDRPARYRRRARVDGRGWSRRSDHRRPGCLDLGQSSLHDARGISRSLQSAQRHPANAEIEHASRLVGEDPTGLFLFETPHGDIWLPQRGDLHSVSVVLAEQEEEMYGRAGGIGVHPGDSSSTSARTWDCSRARPSRPARGKVVTFEVTPKSNQSLRRNLAPEIAAGKVIVIEKGAWHEESILPLVVVDDCSICNSVTHKMPAAFDVPLTTIDQVVEDLHLARVDFIKLDIENAEAQGTARRPPDHRQVPSEAGGGSRERQGAA